MGERENRARWRANNKQHISEKNALYRAAHPELIRDNNLRRQHWTLDLFNETLQRQKYRCAICRCDLKSLPPKQVHADHDHLLEQPRGVLCHHCNTGLGAFRDNPELLVAASDYLKEHT